MVSGEPKENETTREDVGSETGHGSKDALTFRVQDNPPIYISCIYALQIVMSHIHGPLAASYIVHGAVCGGNNGQLLAQIFATSCFLCGLCTILQVALGLRLPITQISASSFLPPILALMTQHLKCPTEDIPGNGGILLASLVEVFLGVTGLIGLLMRFIGPLTIASCVGLVSMSLIDPAINAVRHHWGIACLTTGLAILFSQVLGRFTTPLPLWKPGGGIYMKRFPLIKMFTHLFAYGIPWLLCFILTVTNVFPNDPKHPNYKARVDAKQDSVKDMEWFFIPYPGQWGAPTFSVGIFFGMMAACISSILESVGDYYATARVCQEPSPPKHAINRGITMEGIGGVLSGLFGLGYSTTSYSNSIGIISYTGVGARVAWYAAGCLFILLGVIGKLAGALASVPEPILGGSMMLSLSMVLMVGFTNLEFVEIRSVRNQTVLGLSFILGVMLPRYLKSHPGSIDTGNSDLDQSLSVILESGPCVGGILAAILDNLLPGTKKERGLVAHQETADEAPDEENVLPVGGARSSATYEIPFLPSRLLRKVRFFSYVPCLPTYDDSLITCKTPCSSTDGATATVTSQPANDVTEKTGKASGSRRRQLSDHHTESMRF